MSKRFWIIIASVVAALAIAVALFFLLSGKSVPVGENDGPFVCSYQQAGKSVKVTVSGQFSKNSWISESLDEEIISVDTLKNGKKSATFQISPVAGGMTSAQFTFSAADSEYDGYCVLADVTVGEDNTVQVIAIRQMQGNLQNLSGSAGEFDYICSVSQDRVEVVLTTAEPTEWAYEIDNDSFLTIESMAIMSVEEPVVSEDTQTAPAEEESAGESGQPSKMAATVEKSSSEDAIVENEEDTKTDNDVIMEQMEALGYSEADMEQMGDDGVLDIAEKYLFNEDGLHETEESQEESNSAATTEITEEGTMVSKETHFTFTAATLGDEELVRLCSSSLSKALEITVKCSQDGILEVTDIEAVPYTYCALSTDLQTRLKAFELVGSNATPDAFTTSDYAIEEVEYNGTAAQVVSFQATINGLEWTYKMTKELPAEALAAQYRDDAAEPYMIQYSGIDVTYYIGSDSLAASWQKGDYACYLQKPEEVLGYDDSGETIIAVADSKDIFSASMIAISNISLEETTSSTEATAEAATKTTVGTAGNSAMGNTQ